MARTETGRVEAFSDGVFAIAMTLLVLDLKVPHDLAPGQTLMGALVAEWPTFLAFVTSYATILIMWVNHHRLFAHIGRWDDRLLFSNGLLLFGVVVLPFTTSLVATYLDRPGHEAAAMVYNGIFVLIAVCYNVLWRSASRGGRLLGPDHDPDIVRQITDSYRWGPLIYAVVFVVGIASVTVSLLLNLALALYFALPSALAAHIARRGRSVPRTD